MRSRRAVALRTRHMANHLNAWEAYEALIKQHLRDGLTVLDVGCGKGLAGPFPWEQYPGVELIGLDPDPAAAQNPRLTRFILLPEDGSWPLPDASVEVVICRSVLEHVASPAGFFAELGRVLRAGGVFIFLTPNRWHPSMVASRVLPTRAKSRFLRWADRRAEDDVFPTFYRMNTAACLGRLAREHGFTVELLETQDFEPMNYLDFSLAGYLLSYAHWRVQRGTGLRRWFGGKILGAFRKG